MDINSKFEVRDKVVRSMHAAIGVFPVSPEIYVETKSGQNRDQFTSFADHVTWQLETENSLKRRRRKVERSSNDPGPLVTAAHKA